MFHPCDPYRLIKNQAWKTQLRRSKTSHNPNFFLSPLASSKFLRSGCTTSQLAKNSFDRYVNRPNGTFSATWKRSFKHATTEQIRPSYKAVNISQIKSSILSSLRSTQWMSSITKSINTKNLQITTRLNQRQIYQKNSSRGNRETDNITAGSGSGVIET